MKSLVIGVVFIQTTQGPNGWGQEVALLDVNALLYPVFVPANIISPMLASFSLLLCSV